MNIGWIGLGIMGSRQAANLRRAGHELTVWNRTAATAEAWAAEHGATVAAAPAEVAQEGVPLPGITSPRTPTVRRPPWRSRVLPRSSIHGTPPRATPWIGGSVSTVGASVERNSVVPL